LACFGSPSFRGTAQLHRLRKGVCCALLQPLCDLACFTRGSLGIGRRRKGCIQRGSLVAATRLRGIKKWLW
jgi:hypothetical protein